MLETELFQTATAGFEEVQKDWMPATAVRPFYFDDPAIVWLNFHGEKCGFKPDKTPYDFLDFISQKGREFEGKWVRELAREAVTVCRQNYEVRLAENVRRTIEYMYAETPVIARPALWWAPERVYGVPDLIVHTSWLAKAFPSVITAYERDQIARNLNSGAKPGHYVVFDIKFTTKLQESEKKKDLGSYSAQVRIYSYILGHLQGLMPRNAHIVMRDRLFDPLEVRIASQLQAPLDGDLASVRDSFVEIKLRGANYRPWTDPIVASNLSNEDEKWNTAKDAIAREKFPGRDPALLYQVSLGVKQELSALGFRSLDSILSVDPRTVPLERCRGLGTKRSRVMRTVLQANRSGEAIRPAAGLAPPEREFEYFVDFEYLTNVNVDFENQWPTLEGREMVFMIGVGRAVGGRWAFEAFVAETESADAERNMFTQFIEHLDRETHGSTNDPSRTVLYHWTSAEVWQARRSADRLSLANDHHLRSLPWHDLQKDFLEGPAALPGAWTYGLKEIATALGKVRPDLEVQWPEALQEGLRAMVMGWRAYSGANPLETTQMGVLRQYLEVDCRALAAVLRWLRN